MTDAPPGAPRPLRIEVARVAPDAQAEMVVVEAPPGARVADAVELSGLARRHPELRTQAGMVGIFGRLVSPDTPLADGDRVELYSPLCASPMDMRRRRAAAQQPPRGDLKKRRS